MSELVMRKAERKKAKLRLGITGPAGSGKTVSSLLIAYGIVGDWDKIALIDSENESGDLYENYDRNGVKIGVYNVITLKPPYTPEKYIEAITLAEKSDIECVIIDSLTHPWAGKGGLLEQQGKLADKSGNSYTAWRSITPKHNELVEKILGSSCHMIATLRAKMDYVQEYDDQKKKNVVRKIGLGSIQRDGMEYEFTVFIDVDQNHLASSSKDRTGLVDGQIFTPTYETGEMFLKWLDGGKEPEKQPEKPKCADCGKELRPTNKSTVDELKLYAMNNHGRSMCSDCLKDMAERIKWIKTNMVSIAKVDSSYTENQYREELRNLYGVDSCKRLTLIQTNDYIALQKAKIEKCKQ